MCVCTNVNMYVCICMYIYMYACMYKQKHIECERLHLTYPFSENIIVK
jgi:hypothetical protein